MFQLYHFQDEQQLECMHVTLHFEKKKKTWNFNTSSPTYQDFPGGSDGKVSAYDVGDPGSIPGSGRSPGEGNGNPLQYSCLENPMDGGAWYQLCDFGEVI